jgi:hypothetical protein
LHKKACCEKCNNFSSLCSFYPSAVLSFQCSWKTELVTKRLLYQHGISKTVFCFVSLFLLVYNSCMGVSLWHFHVYVQCTPVWFIPSITPLSTFSPCFLKWLRQVSMFYNHTCVDNTSTIFTLLYPLHLPSPFVLFCLRLFCSIVLS